MTLLHYFSYVGSVAAFVFLTLSLASGLLYISELIEEYSRPAKLIGQRGTYFVIFFHVLLYLCDSMPLPQTLFSLLCHAVYLQNFSNTWPVISLTSIPFVSSCILAVTNHLVWFMYFSRISREARESYPRRHSSAKDLPSFAEIATFFGTCVWLIPLFLFLSLSANDNALPTSTGTSNYPAPPKSSLFKSMFGVLWRGGTPKPINPDTSTHGHVSSSLPTSARQTGFPMSPSSSAIPLLDVGPPPRSPRTPTYRHASEDDTQPLSSSSLGLPFGRPLAPRRRVTTDSPGI